MRLIGVSVVKNEADIIEAMIRHNVRFLDHMLVLDHDSGDATASILQSLVAEGVPLTLVNVANQYSAFDQAEFTTALARRAFATHAADYVFPLDADEFLKVASREALREALEAAGPNVACMRWPTYVPDLDEPSRHPLRLMRWRVESEAAALFKIVVPRQVAEAEGWSIARGNHAFHRKMGNDVLWTTGNLLPDVELAHFPMRMPEQATTKMLIGWLTRRLSYGPNAGRTSNSWHFQEVFRRIVAGETMTPLQMRDYAIALYALGSKSVEADPACFRLVEDAFAEAMPLRYTPAQNVDPLRLLAIWTSLQIDRFMQAQLPA